MTGGPPIPKAPLANPEAAPANVEETGPGIDFKANPFHSRAVATSTKIASASCMGAGEILAKNQTPIGVAIMQPSVNGPSDFQ